MIADFITDNKNCVNCQAEILIDSRFCKLCGSLQNQVDTVAVEEKWTALKQIAVFYGLQLAICAVFKFVDALDTFGWMVMCDAMLAGVTVLFFVYNWHNTKKLLHWPNFSFEKLSLYCAIALGASLIVHYIVTWLNITLFSKEISYYYFFLKSGDGKLVMILFTAVLPALFEELAYRGFVLQKLIKVIDGWQAAFITSFLFAVLHLSFISLFWLIPFAMLLAFVRLKEGSIWYGVAIHFCFNLTACLIEIL